MGRVRDRAVSFVIRRRRNRQLAIHLLLFAVLLLRPLPVIPERLLPAFRRKSKGAAGVGRELVSQAVQLDLVQQRLSRRASLSPARALDGDKAASRTVEGRANK